MSKIFNFENVKLSDRNGIYGGMAGQKEGVLINNEYWLIKYPKSTRSMNTMDISYTTSPLSEYIGSHIYKILGFDVHETVLGIRHNRVVVACKDFCDYPGELREIRTLKNIYNEKLENDLELESELNDTGSSHVVQFKELLLHFKYNPVLSEVDGIEERFWDCLLVDALIKNNDRNNGNWGLLFRNGSYELAPVFDNGAAFSNKLSDEQIEKMMNEKVEFKNNSLNIITAYGDKKHHYNLKYFLSQDNLVGLEESVKRLVPIITKRFSQIEKFINDIPESCNGITVCSPIRKRFYIEGMKIRIDELLVPTYEKILEKEQCEEQEIDFDESLNTSIRI